MLIVKTKIKQSNIVGAGTGLFADQYIKAGDVVWVFNAFFDVTYSADLIPKMNSYEIEFMNTYAFLSKFTGNYILSIDNSHFCNHCEINNNLSVKPGDIEHIEYANRDIEIGEELLINYKDFDANDLFTKNLIGVNTNSLYALTYQKNTVETLANSI